MKISGVVRVAGVVLVTAFVATMCAARSPENTVAPALPRGGATNAAHIAAAAGEGRPDKVAAHNKGPTKATARPKPTPADSSPLAEDDPRFRPGELEVIVRRADGGLASGARVMVWRMIGSVRSRLAGEAATAPDGRVVLHPENTQTVEVEAALGNLMSAPERRSLAFGKRNTFELVLEPAVRLFGIVVDKEDQPVPQATVKMRSHGDARGDTPSLVVTTDAGGAFAYSTTAVSHLPGASLRVELDGYADTIVDVRPIPADGVRLVLRRGVRVLLRARAPDGSPLRVSVSSWGAGVSRWFPRSDGDGTVDISGVPMDHSSLVLRATGFPPRVVRLPAAGDGVIRLGDVAMQEPVNVRGHVRMPPSLTETGARLQVLSGPDNANVGGLLGASGIFGASGAFVLERIPPGRHRLRIVLRLWSEEAWLATSPPDVEFDVPGADLDVRIQQPTNIRLNFVDDATGTPVGLSPIWVWVQRLDGTFMTKGRIDTKTPATNARIVLFDDGPAYVHVQADGFERVRLPRHDLTRGETWSTTVRMRRNDR